MKKKREDREKLRNLVKEGKQRRYDNNRKERGKGTDVAKEGSRRIKGRGKVITREIKEKKREVKDGKEKKKTQKRKEKGNEDKRMKVMIKRSKRKDK